MIELQPFPSDDVVCANEKSGAYFKQGTNPDDFQIIVVGRMRGTPGEYVDALDALTNERLDTVHASILPSKPGSAYAEFIRRRGFVSIYARKAA